MTFAQSALTQRVTPYLGVLRTDLRGYPTVYPTGAVYVTTAVQLLGFVFWVMLDGHTITGV